MRRARRPQHARRARLRHVPQRPRSAGFSQARSANVFHPPLGAFYLTLVPIRPRRRGERRSLRTARSHRRSTDR
eukprot:31487-Pelagococcus_subviridis.AAC.3